jgi:hypothetical protein
VKNGFWERGLVAGRTLVSVKNSFHGVCSKMPLTLLYGNEELTPKILMQTTK